MVCMHVMCVHVWLCMRVLHKVEEGGGRGSHASAFNN